MESRNDYLCYGSFLGWLGDEEVVVVGVVLGIGGSLGNGVFSVFVV